MHVNICGLTWVIRYLKRKRLLTSSHREKAMSNELSAGTTNASLHHLRQHPLTFTHTNHQVTTQHVCLIFNEMTQNYRMPQLGEDSKPTGPEMEHSPVMRRGKRLLTPNSAHNTSKLDQRRPGCCFFTLYSVEREVELSLLTETFG